MISISIYKQSNFPVSSTKIKKTIKDTLRENGLVSDFEVSVAIVGEQKMNELVDEYYKDDPEGQYEHPILTFPTNEIKGTFVNPPGIPLDLGEIIISYPQAAVESNENGKLVDEVICDLAAHGALHLAGIHH